MGHLESIRADGLKDVTPQVTPPNQLGAKLLFIVVGLADLQ